MKPAISIFSRLSNFVGSVTRRVKSAGERAIAKLMPNWGWFGWTGGTSGGWSGNRLEQTQHFVGWPYIAIKAIYEEIAGMHPTVARVLNPDEVEQRSKDATEACARVARYKQAAERGEIKWEDALESALKEAEKAVARRKAIIPRRYRMKALAQVAEHEELEPVKHNHPLARLLRNPNGPQVAWNFFSLMVIYGELTGIAYVWKVRNGMGLPCELWVIPSHWVRPFADPDRQKLIHHYEIRPFGIGASACKFDIPADDMITIPYPNPMAPYTDGYSPFAAIAQWQDTAEAVDASRFFQFRNGPHSTLVAKIDKEIHDPDQAQMDKFHEQVAEKYAGVKNTGKVLIPPPGVELSPISNTPEEMAYVPGAEQLQKWLLAAYRTGSSIVGMAEATNFASMVAARANFILSTIKPKLVFFGQIFTEKLAKEFDPDLVVYWPDVTPDDPAQKLAENVAMNAAGVKAPNEWRAEAGMEPYPHGGDNPMLPMGVSEVPWVKAMPMEAGWELPPGPNAAQAGSDEQASDQLGLNGDGHLSTESNGHAGPRLSTDVPGLNRRGALGSLSTNGKAWQEGDHPRGQPENAGEFGSGGGGGGKPDRKPKPSKDRVPEQEMSEKALRAKAAHHMIDKTVQRYAEEHNEPKFAKKIGGESYPDGEAFDIGIKDAADGKMRHGVELKTMVDNKANKITMKRSAMENKAAWEKKHKALGHTVVLDDSKVFNAKGEGQHDESKRKIFYRRGYGSFRVNTMYQVKDMAELKILLATPNAKLPSAAQRQARKVPA